MPSNDFLTRQRDHIRKRLDEIRPLYEEYLTLEKAHEALEQVEEPIRRAVGRRRGPGRPPKRRGPGRPPGRRRSTAKRTRAGGTRADAAVKVIGANPGITIPELAQKLGIRPNYLYRVTAQLQKERKIRKRGRGFHAS